LTSIVDRMEPSLTEGLCPFTLLDQKDGPVTAVCMSAIGFAAAAFEGGTLVIIDLRGPAIIFKASVQDFTKEQKSGFLRRGNSDNSKPDWVTQLQFSIMMLDGEDYSSILLHAGTNLGHLASFKILPEPSGRYQAQFAGSVSLDSTRVMYIAPINAELGRPLASATQTALGGLSSGIRINGALLVVTPTGAHVFRPATAKGAHRGFDSYFCDSAGIVQYQDQSYALLGLFGDGKARAYAIPSLREITTLDLTTLGSNTVGSPGLDVRRFDSAAIASTGYIMAFTGPSNVALFSIFGTGETLARRQDLLFNPEFVIPPRPTISAVAWVTGTQYITPLDMDILIGGPDRPPSKRMIAQARSEEEQRRQSIRAGSSAGGPSAAQQPDEGYWAYMQRQIQERTEKLGLAGDRVDDLEQNSSQWLADVNKFVGRQKRAAATGLIRAKFGI